LPIAFGTPQREEMVWAREVASSDKQLLAVVTQLKPFNGLGWFSAFDRGQAEEVGELHGQFARRPLGGVVT
jgi:hypothetical protein